MFHKTGRGHLQIKEETIMVNKRSTVIIVAGFLLLYTLFLLYVDLVALNSARRLFSRKPISERVETKLNTKEEHSLQVTSSAKAKGPTLVLIHAYMRTGSSLVGDIMQHSPEAFYVYEPIRALERLVKSKKPFTYVNGTIRASPVSFLREVSSLLFNWFTCNIKGLPAAALTDTFLNKGNKTSKFHQCLGGSKIKGKKNRRAACVEEFQRACEASKFRILKIVRIELKHVTHLLETLSTLKILNLVRDPRATLLSQSHFGMCDAKIGGWDGCASRLCTKIENDVNEEELVLEKYPGRLLDVFYESIAKQPIESSQNMYEFIGANFTREANSYIHKITMAGIKDNCGICTTRSNSSEHVDTWKKNMKIEYIRLINERCKFIIQTYNFDRFPVT